MITADTLIDLDADTAKREPLLARWSRTRTGRPHWEQATDVCLRLWDAHAAIGWDGSLLASAGALRAFEFALAEEVERRYRAADGDLAVAGLLDGELEIATSRNVYAMVPGAGFAALTATVPATASSALFTAIYRAQVELARHLPEEARPHSWYSERARWSRAARMSEVDTPEWTEAVARAHALRTLVHAWPRTEAIA